MWINPGLDALTCEPQRLEEEEERGETLTSFPEAIAHPPLKHAAITAIRVRANSLDHYPELSLTAPEPDIPPDEGNQPPLGFDEL